MSTAANAANAKETPEAASVRETATPVMGSTEATIHTYGAHAMAGAVVEAVANIANPTPGGVGAMIEAAVVRLPAIRDGGNRWFA